MEQLNENVPGAEWDLKTPPPPMPSGACWTQKKKGKPNHAAE